jgi:hypothetical protein
MADSISQQGSDVKDSSGQLESDTEDCSSELESSVEASSSELDSDFGASFPQFSDLPIEVRLMIWKEALPGPRIVYLEPQTKPNYTYYPVRSDVATDDYDEEGYSRFFDPEWEIDIETARQLRNEGDIVNNFSNYYRAFKTRAPPPVLLYVCRESFRVTCKYYERVFGTKSAFPDVWFNFEIDTLFLDWGWTLWPPELHYYEEWFVKAELERVKYLALFIDFRTIWALQADGEEEYLAMWLKSFPNAKKVTINRLKFCHTAAENDTLVFTDPPSPDMRFYIHHEYFGDKNVRLNFYNAYTPDTEVNLQKLEKWRLEEYWVTDPSLLPPLPELDYRMITTPRIKAELIKAEAEWREEMRTLGTIRVPAVVGYVID